MRARSIIAIVAVIAALAAAGPAAAQVTKVYWTDSNNGGNARAGVWRSDPGGSSREGLPGSQFGPWAIDVDSAGGKIYWARNQVYRANLDGSGVETIAFGPLNAIGVAVDGQHGKVYWADGGAPWIGIPSTIGRANLDGSNPETLVSYLGQPREIAVDPLRGKIYWTDATLRAVQRANLDGSGVETIASGGSFPSALAVDVDEAKVYWGDDGQILRANVDGSGRQFVTSAYALGIAVDPAEGKLYFTDLFARRVERANLDGSMSEVIASGNLDTPWGIAVLSAMPDNTPPQLTVPADFAIDATSSAGAVVTYQVFASDNVDPAPAVNCTHESGTTFAIGGTTVACTAVDASGNAASASFVVHVRGAAEQLSALIDAVIATNAKQGIVGSLDAKLGEVQEALAAAKTNDRADACSKLSAFIKEVEAQAGKAVTDGQSAALTESAARIRAVLGCGT
jgi:HYR domain/Low-density lipoprotein receptor repeat class B